MQPGPTRRPAYGTLDARYLVAPPAGEEPYFNARALDLRCAAYPLLILAGLLVFALSCGVFVHHAHLSPSSAARLLSRSGCGDSADLAALEARVRVLEEKVWALTVEAEGRRRAAHGG